MKTIRVDDLKAGVKFDQPVYIDGENILVPAEIGIKQKDLDRLRKWGIETVQTSGNIIKEVAPAKTGGGDLADLKESRSYKELLQIYLCHRQTGQYYLCHPQAGQTGHYQRDKQGQRTSLPGGAQESD